MNDTIRGPLVVQKFGGTSVADSEKILAAARKAIRAQQKGNQVVMVVSAMGKNTDTLIGLAAEITEHPPAREMDMLLATGEQVSVALMAMAVHSLGHKAISLTGAQIGIRTDSTHTKARIQAISTDRMQRALDEGNIVIAAGFQGTDESLDITTLGRGGSDTTAVALAAVLQADRCEIYTDVDGVYTTDPRLLPEARMVPQVSYDEMLELASLGAGVMHNRAVEFAKKYNVPIHVRSSFTDSPGTIIAEDPESDELLVSGAALDKNGARLTVVGVPDQPGVSFEIFSRIAEINVPVDMIVQNVGAEGRADISFTVVRDDLSATYEAVLKAADVLGAEDVTYDDGVAKVSVVGLAMARETGVAGRMFRSLADEDVNILMITTSEIKISCLVSRDHANDALRLVHREFGLEKPPETIRERQAATRTTGRPEEVVERLQGIQQDRAERMEDLTISDISLDDSQARITINGVQNAPGAASYVFNEVAKTGIFIDMIVQSFPRDEHAVITFTVPQSDLERGVKAAKELAAALDCGEVSHAPKVAKLSVSGIGMRSHTGVAIRMFEALAKAEINVEMISTSEVRVNVVVDGKHAKKSLECLQEAFADVRR